MRSIPAACLTMVLLLAACGGSPTGPSTPGLAPVPVVAAENFYGDVTSQIGGTHVKVTSILSDPSVDPHAYESSVDSARAVSGARLVIKNGAGYDQFMDKLMSAAPRQGRLVIDVSQLLKAPADANPHLWYEPATMPQVARAIADRLAQLDPTDKGDFEAGLQQFSASLAPVQERVTAIKAVSRGAKVLPTEPVFDYMALALGLDIVDRDGAFQKAVEEGNDPPAQAVAEFRAQLASHSIKALIYNTQTETPITTDMRNFARQNGVSVIGVSETQPLGKTYQQWMLDQLISLQQALG